MHAASVASATPWPSCADDIGSGDSMFSGPPHAAKISMRLAAAPTCYSSLNNLAGFVDLKEALEQALGRAVDLIDRVAAEQSRNYIRRRRILQEAEPIFAAG